ncbi:ABC transporter ATP-binding protein [Mesorhizobium sp.]|uniref:ABC transporter ATP-binding protein n=1 Tax=Mesorhizobium sp. TaxID=1871066 RepID=UPI000FE8EADD|nr:ABC transporter ATP-binding protein [Mesorhizobium sp.]RWB66306.1 MAG: ABC transporter ATP-binding protein [Mesorhizobium sp.]
MTTLLKVKDLKIEGRRTPRSPYLSIVRGVSFDVARGEVVALIGESGAGKSTIALASMGYAKPGCRFSGGEVIFEGKSILNMSLEEKRAIRGASISYVAQSAAASFNPALRIDDQITEVSVVHKTATRAEARARMIEMAELMQLPKPAEIVKKYPHQVSGGQLQRLMAVMATNARPDLLVLDEPTTALDVTTQIEVLASFKKTLQASGAAAIYVSHDLAVVAQVADRIIVLFDGKVVEEGLTEQILHNPRHEYTRKLMAAVRPPIKLREPGAATPSTQDCVLRCSSINAGYGRLRDGKPAVQILRSVDIAVPKASAVGIIGESGCGKSTLARVIAGLLPASDGDIRLNGKPLAPAVADRSREELRRVQLVMQMPDVAFNPLKTIGQALDRPLEFYLGMPAAERQKRVAELLRMVELPEDFAGRRPHALSGGQKQRVNLARALAANPEVVICDEVTSALDAVVGAAIVDLLKKLQKQTGISLLFISHDLNLVASFTDYVVVLYGGMVVEQGPVSQVLAPPYHPYTHLLLLSVPKMRSGWLEEVRKKAALQASASSTVELGLEGCLFYKRCPKAIAGICNVQTPPLRRLENGHVIACHRDLSELSEPISQSETAAA